MSFYLATAAFLIAAFWSVFDRMPARSVIVATVPGAGVMGFLFAFGGDGSPVLSGAITLVAGLVGMGVGLAAQKILSPEKKPRREKGQPARAPAAPKKKPKGHEQLMSMIEQQRAKVDRLVAGNVQLLDLGKLFESDDTRPQMSRQEAMDLAESVARKLLSPADLMVRHGEEGLIFLFDGLDLKQAEAKSSEIADAISDALAVSDKDSPFVAQGFAHELDEFLGDGIIDSVDDLIRLVKIAHDSYMQKEKGLAKELAGKIKLVPRSVLDPQTLSRFGTQIEIQDVNKTTGAITDISFGIYDPGYASELDCTVIEKLIPAIRNTEMRETEPLFLPVRLASLTNPLYLDNIVTAVERLPKAVSGKLVFCLCIGDAKPPRLADITKGLMKFGKAVFLQSPDVLPLLQKTDGSGVKGFSHAAPTGKWSEQDVMNLKATALAVQSRKMRLVVFGVKQPNDVLNELKIPFSSAMVNK